MRKKQQQNCIYTYVYIPYPIRRFFVSQKLAGIHKKNSVVEVQNKRIFRLKSSSIVQTAHFQLIFLIINFCFLFGESDGVG